MIGIPWKLHLHFVFRVSLTTDVWIYYTFGNSSKIKHGFTNKSFRRVVGLLGIDIHLQIFPI